MWSKSGKDEEQKPTVTAGYQAPQAARPTPAAAAPSERAPESRGALIGPSIVVKGEVSGNEDLLIEGVVEGTIELKQNVVTVGDNGRIRGNIYGRIIHIRGEVTGDSFAGEQVVVHADAVVNGNITAPRMTLEDGAHFKGSIDTNANKKDAQSAAKPEVRSSKSVSDSAARPSTGTSAAAVM